MGGIALHTDRRRAAGVISDVIESRRALGWSRSMKKWIKVKLNSVDYKVYFEAFDGLCSPPLQIDREAEIQLPKGFKKDRYTMELLIHEMIHALDWNLPEEKVEIIGKDLSSALWRIYKPRDKVI